jgi:hypothetical protein
MRHEPLEPALDAVALIQDEATLAARKEYFSA